MNRSVADECPACGSDTGHGLVRDRPVNGFRIVRCDRCRLAFASPRPTPSQLDAVYVESYLASGGATTGYRSYNELPEEQARRSWYDLRSYAFDLLPATGSVLDIGCATGGFLAEAQTAGWSVRGTDYSAEAATRAREINGVEVDAGTLIPNVDEGTRFDLITMWHVLEHLVDPRAALVEIGELLAPAGILVVEVPNWNSVGRLVRGRSWSQLRPPEHINFFTAGSLAWILEHCGFEVVRSSTAYPSLRDRAERHAAPRDRLASALASVASESGAGGYLRMIARRAT